MSALKKQRRYYSGKKKRHTLKTQAVVNRADGRIICLDFAVGRRHDFRLFKESGVCLAAHTRLITDTGYQGIRKLHANTVLPKKRSKKHPLTAADRKQNHAISSERVMNEHVIGKLKRFRILSERYRNRRRRFTLRFHLIAGIYNYELAG